MDSDDIVDAIDNCPTDFNLGQEDADGDAIGDVCDNCVFGPNSNQGAAPFSQMIMAVDSETFSWSVPGDVVYVKGGLSGVMVYAVDTLESLAFASSFTDSSLPGSGAGFYYVVRPDCVVGSWQTIVGAEPVRDLALP